MASDNNDQNNEKGQDKTISFKFTKRKQTLNLSERNKEYKESEEDALEKDFIHSAEGKRLKSVNPKDEEKELVIPCLARNDALFAKIKEASASTLDKEAAQEIMKDLSKVDNPENGDESGYTIPMLAKTTAETTTTIASETANLPTESTLDDYSAVPVSQFGAALLRGMGWKKGEAIGGINKGLTVPIEFIPRSRGLGLGAEPKLMEEGKKKKRRKPGDEKSDKHSGPIVEKDGKVRHFKSLDEKVSDRPPSGTTFSPGGYVVVEAGPHRNLSGKITGLDEDNARVFVCLAINSQDVTLSQHNVRIVDREEYKQYSQGKSSQNIENGHRKQKRRPEEDEQEDKLESSPKKHKTKHEKGRDDKKKYIKEKYREKDSSKSETRENCDEMKEVCWMAPLIRVRVVSKDFKKGKYYHKKVIIQDVISKTSCTCKSDEGRLLDDVPQNVLETVIPKGQSRFVLVVQGKCKGLIAEVVETDSSKQQAIIQILRDKSVTKTHYDDISEYTGDIHRE